jgi:hypothetical protein
MEEEMTDIVRNYLEDETNIDALESTPPATYYS